MKHYLVLATGLLLVSASSYASIDAAFSCKASLMPAPGKVFPCTVSVDPSDQSTRNQHPGSIVIAKFAGTFKLTCSGGPTFAPQTLALWEENEIPAQDISDIKAQLTDTNVQQFGTYALDADKIVSGRQYDAALEGSVLEFTVGQMKDSAGNTVGYLLNSSLGLLVGCVK